MNNIDLNQIEVIKGVAWRDERPQCDHLIASWRAGRDTGSRCAGYGMKATRRGPKACPGYCPMNGRFCAMEDPTWTFKPGWDRWSKWRAEEHGYYTSEVWPGFRPGDLVAYVVDGDCMSPTYQNNDVVVVRLGAEWRDGDAVVLRRLRVDFGDLPLRGKYLKRLERVGNELVYMTADNPAFEPMLLPAGAVKVEGVVQDVSVEDAWEELAPLHAFDYDGEIAPVVRAAGAASAALEVWYKSDIRNALMAAEQASSASLNAGGDGGEYAAGYQAGYQAALATLALNFGLVPLQVDGPSRKKMYNFLLGGNGQ